jgi:hypothetical protein
MRTINSTVKDYIWCERRQQQRAIAVCVSTCPETKRHRCRTFRAYIGNPMRNRRTKREVEKNENQRRG